MNKFLTLVFLGLLLVILRLSTQPARPANHPALPTPDSYANQPVSHMAASRINLPNVSQSQRGMR